MRLLMQYLTLAAVAACSSGPSAPNAGLNEEFTLGVGGHADVGAASISLRFVRVVSDSRCPADVECIWAGNAQIALEVRRGAERDILALNTFDGAREAVIGQHRIRLVALTPAPLASDPIEPDEYRATLLVFRVNGQVCTAEARPAIVVAVVDSLTGGVGFTNVRAIARDGTYADTATQAALPSPIHINSLPLAYERAGTYTVTVTADGHQPWVKSGVVVDRDDCHVATVPLTARMVH